MEGNTVLRVEDVQFDVIITDDLQKGGDHALLGTDLHAEHKKMSYKAF